MSATLLPSNLVTPNASFEKNPNWTPNESSVPQANVLVEDGNARIMVVVGKNPKVVANDIPTSGWGYTTAFGEGVYTEETATFSMKNVSLQQCTAIQLESAYLNIPGSGAPPAQRNLTQNLCGDLVSDEFITPRRFVLSGVDMNVPLMIDGVLYNMNVYNHIPYGQNIAYYTLADVLTYFVNAWNTFMVTMVGDATFYATIYLDSIGPRLFWTSSTYGQHKIRIILSEFENRQANFFNILMNHIQITDLRAGDTSQVSLGYGVGESLGFQPRQQTGFQNNSIIMSIHCNELTQFRKSDSIAPIEGTSIIGTLFPLFNIDMTRGFDMFYSSKTGSLISPKIAFDRTQTLTEFTVTLRVMQGTGNAMVALKPTELQSSICVLTFRLW